MLSYGPKSALPGVAQLLVAQSYPENYWIETYTDYELVPGGVTFDCKMTGGHRARVWIEAVADDIIRVRMALEPRPGNQGESTTRVESTPAILTSPPGLQSIPPDIMVREEERRVVIATSS